MPKTKPVPPLPKFVDRYAEACGIVSVPDLIAIHAEAFPEVPVTYDEMAQAAGNLVSGFSQPRKTWSFQGTEYALSCALSDAGVSEAVFYDAKHQGRTCGEQDVREAIRRAEGHREELVELHGRLPVKRVFDWDFPWPWRDGARDTPSVQALIDCICARRGPKPQSRQARSERMVVGSDVERVARLIMTMNDNMEDELDGYARSLSLDALPPSRRTIEAMDAEPLQEVLEAVIRVYDESSLWGLNGWSPQEVRTGKVTLAGSR